MPSSGRHPWDSNDPYPGDEDERDCPVDCSEYEADLMTGMATCPDCGRRWVLSAVEIESTCRQVLGIKE